MKKIKQQKSGISLIVLVITIIVMIILAAAIILSLDGSNIIERAKGAQSSNDVATAKEIVALARSEWSFEKKEGYDTFREYAESKLEEAGFNMDNTYVEDNGRVLFDTAARFAKAGVEIGTEVIGYTLNSTASYTTSGKENTLDSDSGTPVTLTRDAAIKWTYIGVDEDGNALIAGSVSEDSPTIFLGGKGGFADSTEVLDGACRAMYSSIQGTARNMKIEDVTRVLEYRGEEGVYFDQNYNEVKTREAKTIIQIAKEIGYDITGFKNSVPETGKAIGAYKSDSFGISTYYDVSKYNTGRAYIIYPASGNAKLTTPYWLSSPCVNAYFNFGYADFNVRFVDSSGVSPYCMFSDDSPSGDLEVALRPVVQLTSDIQVTYNGTTAAIN